MSGEMEWLPVEKITTDPTGPYVQILRDYWWITDAEGRIALWRGKHPQCNQSEKLARRFAEKTEGATGVTLISLAFAPIELEDYR